MKLQRVVGMVLGVLLVLSLAVLPPASAGAQPTASICDTARNTPSTLAAFTQSEQAVISVACEQGTLPQGTASRPHIFYTTDFYQARERLRARGLLPNAPSSTANMTYHNGDVMQTVTAYTIFWSPNNTLSNTYKSLINRYFTDINASPFYNINTQYSQLPGPVFMQNSSTLGGTWTDTGSSNVGNGYPSGRGTVAHPLTDQDIRDEVSAALAANPSWGPPDLTKQFFVYYEQGIEQCSSSAQCTPGIHTVTKHFCAYHWSFSSNGNTVIYANMPYDETWPSGCRRFSTSPNGDLASDIEVSTSSHEHFEAATDPQDGGWFDFDGTGENGDKCVDEFGTSQPDGHNMVLNGNPYKIQLEWSNAALDPMVPFSGCVKRYNAAVDVGVSKTAPASVVAGTALPYTITLTNHNTTFEATDVALTDVIPAGTTFVSLAQPAGQNFSCTTPASGAAGVVRCTRLTLPAGGSATFTLLVQVPPTAANGTTIANTASVSSTSGDLVAANNVASASTTVHTVADLSVEKQANTDLAIPGIAATYALTVTNNGPSDAQNVSLADTLPANTTFITGAQTSGPLLGCSWPPVGGAGTLACSLPTLPIHATATFTVALLVGPADTSAITNTATMSSTTTDPNLANNSASATIQVSIHQYKQRALDALIALSATLTNTKDIENIHEASEALSDSLKLSSWLDGNTLVREEGVEVLINQRNAVNRLDKLMQHNASGIAPALLPIITQLVAADRALADVAITQAIDAAGQPKHIAQAQKLLVRGDKRAAAGKYGLAVDTYKNAWKEARAAA